MRILFPFVLLLRSAVPAAAQPSSPFFDRVGIKVFSDSLAAEHEKVEEYLKGMDWGIDVIQTNHPLRALRAVELFKRQTP